MGHLRSGSTLLLHLLSSHPDILSWGEQRYVYQSQKDLRKLILKTNLKSGHWIKKNPKFYLDQLTHNHLTPDLDVLKASEIHLIFLLRSPGETISSLYFLHKRLAKETLRDTWNMERAIDNYIIRLTFLRKVYTALRTNNKYFACTYCDLINHTEATLENIRQILNLATPFQKGFDVFPYTGKRGDSSDLIKMGRIIRKQKTIIEMPKEILRSALEEYEKTADLFGVKQN